MRLDCKNIVLKEMAVLYSNDLPKYSRNLHDPLMAILMLGIADRPFLVFSQPKIQFFSPLSPALRAEKGRYPGEKGV